MCKEKVVHRLGIYLSNHMIVLCKVKLVKVWVRRYIKDNRKVRSEKAAKLE